MLDRDRLADDLTIVVNFHNMQREAKRTLVSLLPDYQHDTSGIAYEIVAIDNGSTQPLDPQVVRQVAGDRCRLVRIDTNAASPAAAINSVIRQCSSEWIMCLIDGARIASPGMVGMAMAAARLYPKPFVYTLAMHLGRRLQNEAMMQGYDQSAEDELLSTVDWQRNGYSLFNISVVSPARVQGFFSNLYETNCFLMRRNDFLELGGLCEEFQSPGGGLVNHDFFNRVHEDMGITPVMLLGEATFHQFHGGVSTNIPLNQHPWRSFAEEYRSIRNKDFQSSWRPPIYFGALPEECKALVNRPGKIASRSWMSKWKNVFRKLLA